jgi:AcrR family transcriptional regulator
MYPGPSMTATATKPRRATALPIDERRAAIVEAVLPLLVEHGEDITCRQIASAAGIAEGTIFRAFADKDELLAAVLDAALDQAPMEAALRGIDRTAPFEQQLVAATELIQRRVNDVWQIVSKLGRELHDRATRPLTDSAALVDLFAAHAHELRVEPVEAARVLRGLTLALTHPMLAGEPKSADEIVAVVLHGIGLAAK